MVIMKLRKAQSDKVYREKREFSGFIERTKLDRYHFYHHGTTQARSVEPSLQLPRTNLRAPQKS
jgi:hypothetical protein